MPESSPDKHPPRPQPTVRVAISGHRWNNLRLGDGPAVQARFDEVLAWIEHILDDVCADREAGYLAEARDDPPPTKVFRVLSGLAEGADRLGAKAAVARGWKLTAVLPFPRWAYLCDFKTRIANRADPGGPEATDPNGRPDRKSLAEFRSCIRAAERTGGVQVLDGTVSEEALQRWERLKLLRRRAARGAAPERRAESQHRDYRPLASALCLNSDVVVAVWNQDEGKPGGTGDVVRLAGEYGIPVVVIPPDGKANPWFYDQRHPENREGLAPLNQHLRRLLVAPRWSDADRKPQSDLREAYFREGRGGGRLGWLWGWGIYDRFLRLLSPAPESQQQKPPPAAAEPPRPATPEAARSDLAGALREKWEKEWRAQGAGDEVVAALTRTGIHRHYAWASHLASHYGACYRDAFLANYMLSWLAVAAGAFGVVFHQAGWESATYRIAIVEVALLSGIVLIVWRGGRRDWHARWLDYRRVAEGIRLLPMMLLLGRTPVLVARSSQQVTGQESWADWMFRAVVREAGVLPLDLALHLPAGRRYLEKGLLDSQIRYHRGVATRMGTADEVLHFLTAVIFVLALLLAGAHVLDLWWAIHHDVHLIPATLADALVIPTLALPALGAALHGFRSQGEFEATAKRSELIEDRLREVQKELSKLPGGSVERLAEIAVDTATVMNAELSAWFSAYQNKGIQLA